jgi:hypothetical protein
VLLLLRLVGRSQYIDESYLGGGIGEYSYYDPYAKAWDTSACDAHGNGRCAPMDCHLNNSTTWKLMGVFKEAGYFGKDAFFEQLLKHEGVCLYEQYDVGGYDFYEFMSEARESSWTEGCVKTSVQITSSFYKYNDYYKSQQTDGYLYIDLKPTWNGNMTYGLYTDSTCKYEYELPDADVDSIAKTMGLLYGNDLTSWNNGLEAYKVCQPCRAYNIHNDYSTDEYSDYYSADTDPNEGYFQCNDDARYTNVNQCMKFRTHADLEVATWEDLVTATNQGGILEVNVSGTIFGSERMSAEDYKYLIKMRQEEVSSEARKVTQYRLDAARVENMKPEVKTWNLMGGVSLATGLLCLLGVACLLRRKHFGRPQEKKLKQPLLAKRDYFLSGPSGSMMTTDVDYCPSMHLSPNPTAHTLPNLDEEEEDEDFAPVTNVRITESRPTPPPPDHTSAKQKFVMVTPPPDHEMAKQELGDDSASSMSTLSYVSDTPRNDKKDELTKNEVTYDVVDDSLAENAREVNQAFDEIIGSSHQDEHEQDISDVIELVNSYVEGIGKKGIERQGAFQHRRQGSLLDNCSEAEDSNPGEQADTKTNVPTGEGSPERKENDREDEIMAARDRLYSLSTSF